MDKRKPANSAPDVTIETDKTFLDKSGATDQIKDVLAKVIENRPADPVSFLADYFESLGDKVDRVGKAQQQICLTHYTKPAFHTNIRAAYDILSQNKVLDRRGKPLKKEGSTKQLRGITGTSYNELLKDLCKEFPQAVKDKLLKKIMCRDHEVVLFAIFCSGVFTCLVLKDFLSGVTCLYKSLEQAGQGKASPELVDKLLCETILHLLQDAVKTTKDSTSSVLEAGYKLGPDRVYAGLATAMFKSGGPKGTMTLEDFLVIAADSFLQKVTPLK